MLATAQWQSTWPTAARIRIVVFDSHTHTQTETAAPLTHSSSPSLVIAFTHHQTRLRPPHTSAHTRNRHTHTDTNNTYTRTTQTHTQTHIKEDKRPDNIRDLASTRISVYMRYSYTHPAILARSLPHCSTQTRAPEP
eukprot:GHVU01056379.1.p1 GENE.GHVU01056379.1~~GHVU01056379.1.p1  ORF type:complete len:137 (-),score=5.81 GHVU01056379.1:394-804(-)